jgi:hypothetical protein
MSSIIIPISIGEAIDKQTILEIKLDRLTLGTEYVFKEYALISEQIHKLLTDDAIFHKNILRVINEEIWNLQDEFRDELDSGVRAVLCENIIQLNDSRFRIKKKLDALLDSSLKEQKGYQNKKAFFLGHLGLGDQINCIPLVRYLSSRYDSVYVVCKSKHLTNLKLIYRDDYAINFYPVDSDEFISPAFGFPLNNFEKITEGFEVYSCGLHNPGNSNFLQSDWENHFSDLPFCFYRDLKISPSIFYSYHHIANSKESDQMYDQLHGLEFIIMQSSTSDGPLINTKELIEDLNIDIDQTLLIDINQNLYPQGHIWNAIAESFINRPLLFYKKTLMNAQKLILTDSSLFCMAIGLPLICSMFYYKSRNNHDYTYIHKFVSHQHNKINYEFIRLI